jgi:hypothetical protein
LARARVGCEADASCSSHPAALTSPRCATLSDVWWASSCCRQTRTHARVRKVCSCTCITEAAGPQQHAHLLQEPGQPVLLGQHARQAGGQDTHTGQGSSRARQPRGAVRHAVLLSGCNSKAGSTWLNVCTSCWGPGRAGDFCCLRASTAGLRAAVFGGFSSVAATLSRWRGSALSMFGVLLSRLMMAMVRENSTRSSHPRGQGTGDGRGRK